VKLRALFTLTAAFTLAVAAPGMAAGGKVKAQPGIYDPGATGIVVADWQGGVGEPDVGSNGSQGLVLQKNGPTETNAAAGAEILGFEGQAVSELGFDYKTDGYCSGGSPRFDVQTTDGFYFVGGCGNAVPEDRGNGWSRVRFDTSAITGTIEYVEVIADEQGQSVLDNIDVNGTLIGKAGNL
jgi:hypothetical protein